MIPAFIKNKYFHRLMLLIIFIVTFFAVRAPLLTEDLGFEEGIFADLIVNRPSGPKYSLGGRIDGVNQYNYISHPAVSYELLRFGGFVFEDFLDRKIYLDDEMVTPRLRLVSSFYQFIFFSGLLIFVLWNQSICGKWPIIIIFAAALSPLAIKTSPHLQIDNTSGVILCGTAALLFTIAGRIDFSNRMKFLLLFAGGFIAGLGKQEWSFALMTGLIVTLLYFWIIKKLSQRHIIALFCVISGLFLSNVISYLYDPTNYLLGLHYIGVFSQSRGIHYIENPWLHWLTLMKLRVPFVLICFVLLFPAAYFIFFRKRKDLCFWLVTFYGLFLFLGYIVSNWTHRPRYFCPSLAVLTISPIAINYSLLPRLVRYIFLASMMFIFVSTVVFLHGYVPNKNKELEQIQHGALQSSVNTVLYLSSGAGWNKPNIDYANNNSPYDKVRENISEKHNKILIKPEDIVSE